MTKVLIGYSRCPITVSILRSHEVEAYTCDVLPANRPPDQIIQPYEFGDDASKATGLWLDRLPKLELDPTQRVPGRIVNGVERWANQTDSGQNRLPPSETRWLERSKTYPGIATAFATQWRKIV